MVMKYFYVPLLFLLVGAIELDSYSPVMKGQKKKVQAKPHLTYFGGPVISNVQIVDVLWGPNVNKTVANNMPNYLSALVKSAWLAWLCEYNTLGKSKPTSNQVIGLGNFVGQKTIVPFNKKKVLSDKEIQVELTKQLNAGNLPKPKNDAEGRTLTMYVIEFPHDIFISSQGGSCAPNGFCGYHSAMKYKGKPLIYSVQPDFGPGSGCDVGCGNGTMLQNQQSTHSHEIAEAITDPDGPFATSINFPVGWYDRANGEIGDICSLQQAQITVAGQKITVQKLWSNSQNKCIATNPNLAKGPVVSGPKCVRVGKTAQLKVTGAKGPFQWYHNGVLVPNATTAVLTIKNAKKSDAGNYFARGSCTRASNTFVLKVK
jgi:hypothetical protein